MAKNSPKLDVNKERLKLLKSYGLSDIDGRKNLSVSEKQQIRRAYKKYEGTITQRKSDFLQADSKKFTRQEIKDFEKSGYQKINGKIFISREQAKSVKIKKTKNGYVIERKISDRKKESEFVTHGIAGLNLRDRLISQYDNGGFKKGDFLGLKLFDQGHFKRSIFTSIDDVYKYATDEFSPKGEEGDLDFLRKNLKLVKKNRKEN